MSQFTKVNVWTWERFFKTDMSMATTLEATEEQVRLYIENRIELGGCGNWSRSSLKSKITKIKTSKLTLTDVTKP